MLVKYNKIVLPAIKEALKQGFLVKSSRIRQYEKQQRSFEHIEQLDSNTKWFLKEFGKNKIEISIAGKTNGVKIMCLITKNISTNENIENNKCSTHTIAESRITRK